ncbi:MAG: hypothetical protein WBZ36_13890 [Candidatus Nitrosopolaris sp.]
MNTQNQCRVKFIPKTRVDFIHTQKYCEGLEAGYKEESVTLDMG